MSYQIIRVNIHPNILFDLLEKVCIKTDKYYIIDINAYKKILFHNYHEPFLVELKNYYHISKYYYLTRKFTYNSFINIVRHICKNANIIYTSEIKYNKSLYNIDYHIYYTS